MCFPSWSCSESTFFPVERTSSATRFTGADSTKTTGNYWLPLFCWSSSFVWKLKFLKKAFCRSLVNSKCSTTKPCHNSFITDRCNLDVCNQAWLRVNWIKELSYEVIWASLLELQIVQCSVLHRHHQTHKWSDIPFLNNLVRKISHFIFLNW